MQKRLRVGRNAVGVAGADADQQVTASTAHAAGNRAVHADRAEVERLGIRDTADVIMVCADEYPPQEAAAAAACRLRQRFQHRRRNRSSDAWRRRISIRYGLQLVRNL